MTDLLSHRGPDDAGLLVDPPATLGHRRLSILDLSPGGHQPMPSHDDRLWITFNGEIYNYKELAAELRARPGGLSGRRATRRCSSRHTKSGAVTRFRPPERDVRIRDLGQGATRALLRSRPLRGQALLLHDGRGALSLRVRDQGAAPRPGGAPHPERSRGYVDFLAYGITDHTAETLFEGILQLRARHLQLVVRPDEKLPEAAALVRAAAGGVRRAVGDGRAPRAPRRRSRAAPEKRRPGRDDPVRRARLVFGDGDRDHASPRGGAGARPRTRPAATDPRIDEGRCMEPMLRTHRRSEPGLHPSRGDLLDHLDHVLWHQDEPFHSAAVYGNWKMSELARTEASPSCSTARAATRHSPGYEYLLYPGLFWTLLAGDVLPGARRDSGTGGR